MGIKVENVRKEFGGANDKNFVALDDVSLDVATGELIALLGPSGSGKTTLLRIIAGLEYADQGEIYLDSEETSKMPVQNRRVGFVFQHYALFRHMTVFDNIAFGLKIRDRQSRPDAAVIRERVMRLIELVHLSGLHNRYPSQLSGGQRQRVALARALAVDPKVLLLDEPFGALDAKVRKELRRWLRNLHDELNITTVFVTHDQEEAMELADRVVVMNAGRIEQAGTPEVVYHDPANAFVYDFLGNYNVFDGWRDPSGEYHIITNGLAAPVGAERVKLFARPHDMDVAAEAQDSQAIAAKITHINPAGPLVSIEMQSDHVGFLQAALPRQRFDEIGRKRRETVFLKPRELRVFE